MRRRQPSSFRRTALWCSFELYWGETVGLKNVEVRSIDISTCFRDFDDYWTPFLGGQFPAPDYAMVTR